MKHHLELYPPTDLESLKYRSAGLDSGLIVFVPTITLAVAILVAGAYAVGLPIWLCAAMAFEAVFIGWAHDYIHDSTHIKGHWLGHVLGAWYWHMRKLHRTHHRNMRRNLGVIWFGWDKIFGTLKQSVD